jgi:hypothetical protein
MNVINEVELERFVYWILERENIRLNKEVRFLPRPWSSDPIFNTYHFCNVRREDDRGTKEIREVVLSAGVQVENLPAVYTAARLLNKASSLKVLQEHGLGYGGFSTLKQMRADGETVFHTAYVVSTCGAKMDKLDYIQSLVARVIETEVPRTSCEDAYQALLKVPGMGTFLAAQVVADLKNDRYLAYAPDFETFSTMGPGSKKGLDAIFNGGTTHHNYERRISLLESKLPKGIQEMNIHRQDLQNCLCEFSKYHRLAHNLPGRRRPYK